LVKYGKRVNYDGKKNSNFIILDGPFGLDNIFICLFDFTFCDSKQQRNELNICFLGCYPKHGNL